MIKLNNEIFLSECTVSAFAPSLHDSAHCWESWSVTWAASKSCRARPSQESSPSSPPSSADSCRIWPCPDFLKLNRKSRRNNFQEGGKNKIPQPTMFKVLENIKTRLLKCVHIYTLLWTFLGGMKTRRFYLKHKRLRRKWENNFEYFFHFVSVCKIARKREKQFFFTKSVLLLKLKVLVSFEFLANQTETSAVTKLLHKICQM